jgi:hypothetical protein
MYLDSDMPPPKPLTLSHVSFTLFKAYKDAASADAEEGLSVEVHALSNGLHVSQSNSSLHNSMHGVLHLHGSSKWPSGCLSSMQLIPNC